MENIEYLQFIKHRDQSRAEPADKGTRRFLLWNEGAEDGGNGNDDQECNGQFYGGEEGPHGIFFINQDNRPQR